MYSTLYVCAHVLCMCGFAHPPAVMSGFLPWSFPFIFNNTSKRPFNSLVIIPNAVVVNHETNEEEGSDNCNKDNLPGWNLCNQINIQWCMSYKEQLQPGADNSKIKCRRGLIYREDAFSKINYIWQSEYINNFEYNCGCSADWLVAGCLLTNAAWVRFPAGDLTPVLYVRRAFHLLSELHVPSVLRWGR